MKSDMEINYNKKKCFELLKLIKTICENEKIWYSLAGGTMLGAVRHKGFIPWDTDIDIFIMLPDKDRFRNSAKKYIPKNVNYINFDNTIHFMSSHDLIYFADNIDAHVDIYFLCGAPTNKKEQAIFAFISGYSDRIIRSKYHKIKDCKRKNRVFVFFAKILDSLIPDKILKKFISYKENKYNFDKAEYVIPMANWGTATSCIPKKIFNTMIKQEFNGELFDIPKEYDIYLSRTYGKNYMIPKKY